MLTKQVSKPPIRGIFFIKCLQALQSPIETQIYIVLPSLTNKLSKTL